MDVWIQLCNEVSRIIFIFQKNPTSVIPLSQWPYKLDILLNLTDP